LSDLRLRGHDRRSALTGDEIGDLLGGKRPVREAAVEPSTPRSSAVRRDFAAAAGLRPLSRE